ncbi:BREX-2 system phosphatase PglZ [Micromonospora sp. WMMD714]|uniref:BREX-2 system phosphatase PglZ n=1 Tax=Micromonospora sp. WMMD714 TaxID=3016097 RepID=UPI00249BDF99|nr:BREX-2 system phosphatase PglZ [Micromonospora sp. WMMD714]WFE67568.1 BREX-2 system phosphatase PglZ [Micromonospora sp. WMMD714]
MALRQKVGQQLTRHRNGDAYPVLVLRAEPNWPYEPTVLLPDGRQARVVPGISPLSVWEHLVADRQDEVLVVLTDIPESQLGQGVRSRIFRQQVIPVESWDLVVDAFGAQLPDSALELESWAGEALLDAMPPAGWPRLSTRVLTRDVALRHLAAVRLGLERRGENADDLDVAALLRWSVEPGAVQAFGLLRPAERDGLVRWLVEQFGRPARALFALVGVGHGVDALPLGLVCDAVWTRDAVDAARVQGRIDQYFGHLDDDTTVRGFANATVEVVVGMVTAREAAVNRQGHAVLHRAEELLVQFGGVGSAGQSTILRTGFIHRVDEVARALRAGLADPAHPALAPAVENVAAHLLADSEAIRIRRIRMAQRLVRWLGGEAAAPASVADGIQRQIAEWGWVDRALHQVWAGDDIHLGLQQVFREVHDRVQQRRRDLDEAFAGRLAAWATAGPGNDAGLLTIENLLPTVVEPLIRARYPVLLVVLDGMSAAVAVELADELSQQWVEYDPLGAGVVGRRRGVVAALPTLTATSRTSLFAGALRSGSQEHEKRMFAEGRWGHGARIFHKGPARGAAGEVLSEDLRTAMADPAQLVAVVINTVDESLAHGREGDEAGWQLNDLGFLRSLLDLASYSGRAVLITSDHGHVLERGGELVKAPDAASARHRTGAAPVGPGEIELRGPRVLAEGQRIIALWDPLRRYRPSKAGYHGGVSLAEVTIPLLAYLLPNVTAVPAGWVPVQGQRPDWWQPAATEQPATIAPARPSAPKSRRKVAPLRGEVLFDIPAQTAAPGTAHTSGDGDLVTVLLDTELFEAQHGLTPRRVDRRKVEAALRALVEAKGVLPVAVLAQRAGELPVRAGGFVATMQRIFNIDNYPVLTMIDDGRTVRLDIALLRTQFGLPGGGS